MALALERAEKGLCLRYTEIRDLQHFYAAASLACEETQKEHQSVAVTANRVSTHTAESRQILFEKPLNQLRQFWRWLSAHVTPGSMRCENCCPNRSLASVAI